MNRETHKDIKIGERNFRLKKFDALTGSYIAYTLMAEMLPMGLNEQIGIPAPEANAKKEIKKMSKKDFAELQHDCLRVCTEILPAGEASVLDEAGRWGVIGLETDTSTVLVLTIQVLVFNVKSFFDESLLTSLSEAMSGMHLPNVPT